MWVLLKYTLYDSGGLNLYAVPVVPPVVAPRVYSQVGQTRSAQALGIPAERDRVVQQAPTVLRPEPRARISSLIVPPKRLVLR